MGVTMAILTAGQELAQLVTELSEARIADPGNDLVSALVTSEVDGEHLTTQELASFFILSSWPATRPLNAIAHGLVSLTEHPDQKQRWLDDIDGMAPTAVEEIVRWASPVIHFRRTVTQDGVRLGDQEFSEGDKVVLWYWSGNRDEAVFADPHVFDVGRMPNDHIGFMARARTCLGAHLARREITVMSRSCCAASPTSARWASPPLRSGFINGIKHLPPSGTPSPDFAVLRTRVRRTAKKIGYEAAVRPGSTPTSGASEVWSPATSTIGSSRSSHSVRSAGSSWGVHLVQARDVGQLEDLLVGQVLLQGGEHTVRHPPPPRHQGVRVGQHRPLGRRPAVGDGQWGSAGSSPRACPAPGTTWRAASRRTGSWRPSPPGTGRASRSSAGSVRFGDRYSATRSRSARARRGPGERRPPVPGRAGGGAGVVDRIAVRAEDEVVHGADDGRSGLVAADLAKARHGPEMQRCDRRQARSTRAASSASSRDHRVSAR